jgi:hypothetical protein
MKQIKHIGKIKNTGSRVVVVFRTIPGESNNALVVHANNLPDSYHDSLMSLVESEQAQDAFEFGEIMFSRPFPDGRPMLKAVQEDGRLQKYATDMILMTPYPTVEIRLDQLNTMIAEQKNCAVDDLCNFVSGSTIRNNQTKTEPKKIDIPNTQTDIKSESTNQILTDQDLARSYRSQADAMYKEAARLRREADSLDPPKKKAKTEEITS